MTGHGEFESNIAKLTQPINGQYPRPWMTALRDPSQAKVFIVGGNQAKEFRADKIGNHDQFLDAMFNRNGQSCRGLYDEVTIGKPSRTRLNLDAFVQCLGRHGVDQVLETNVICYSTPSGGDLRLPQHAGGRERGELIFRELLRLICPRVLVVHGVAATEQLARMTSLDLPQPNEDTKYLVQVRTDDRLIIVLPSLAQPKFNSWKWAAPEYFERVSKQIASELSK